VAAGIGENVGLYMDTCRANQRAEIDASTEKARMESAHVVSWEHLSPHWRQIHLRSAAAAVRAVDEHRTAEGMLL
jgi:head-tail adaptor